MHTLRIEHRVQDDTVEAAQAMHQKMLGIWAGPGKAVMVEPTARVVETVEAAQP
jgi:hypothetical protein